MDMSTAITVREHSWRSFERPANRDIPITAITRVHIKSGIHAEVYAAGKWNHYDVILQKEQLQNAFKAANMTPIVLEYPRVGDISKQGTTYINPNFVNFVYVPKNADERSFVSLHDSPDLMPSSETSESLLAAFKAAKIDLVPVPLLHDSGTAHVAPLRIKAITSRSHGNSFERIIARFEAVFNSLRPGASDAAIRESAARLTTAWSPRQHIIFADYGRIHVPSDWDRSTVLSPRHHNLPSP